MAKITPEVRNLVTGEQERAAGIRDNFSRLRPGEGWGNSHGRGVITGFSEYRGYVVGLLEGSGSITPVGSQRLRQLSGREFDVAIEVLLTPATEPSRETTIPRMLMESWDMTTELANRDEQTRF